jgi:[ribosomal protein S5]-alanine N-acetyltransferase
VSEIVAATDRILLTAAGEDDEAEFLAAVATSGELHHPWVDVADTPARYRSTLDRARGPEFRPFLIRDRDDGRLAGAINVSNMILGAFRSAFVGYWAFAGKQGRGLMGDGLRSVVHHAFDDLDLHRLEANIQPGNLASIALAERCGFRFEGFSPNYLMVDGAWRDHNRYAITQEDVAGSGLRPAR